MAAYKRGDYATALREWRPFAEQGYVDAQYNLGVMYAGGKGVPRDEAEAARWFRLAAEQGHAGAQSDLAASYRNGWGIPKDYVKAVIWYRKAAEQGKYVFAVYVQEDKHFGQTLTTFIL